MRIGFTLPISYLAGDIASDSDVLWSHMFSQVTDNLKHLKEHGVTSVEIHELTEKVIPARLRLGVETVLKAGLEVTLHGWLPKGQSAQEPPNSIREAAVVLAEYGYKNPIPLTLHSHHTNANKTVSQATTETINDLNNLGMALTGSNSLFTPALEICRDKDGGPVGITYSEIMEIANQIGFNRLGLCWDMGHSQANHLKQGHPAFPNGEFVEHVIHTHIHDIGPGGKTHGPIVDNQGYIKRCIDMLQSQAYAGIYHLELYPMRWCGTPKERKMALTESIKKVIDMASSH